MNPLASSLSRGLQSKNILFWPSYREGKNKTFAPSFRAEMIRIPACPIEMPVAPAGMAIHRALAIKNRIHVVSKNMDTCCLGYKEQGNPA